MEKKCKQIVAWLWPSSNSQAQLSQLASSSLLTFRGSFLLPRVCPQAQDAVLTPAWLPFLLV